MAAPEEAASEASVVGVEAEPPQAASETADRRATAARAARRCMRMEVVLSSWVPCDRGPVPVGGELSNDGSQPTSGRLVVDYRPTQRRVVVGC